MTRSPFPALFALAAALILLPSAVGQDEDKKKDDYKEKTAKHKEDVTKLRGLEFKAPVAVGAYSKQELLDFLKAEFEKDLPKEKAERYQRGYAKFGLIPADLDIYEAYLELFGSSIAGFYHPKTKELRLIRAGEKGDAEEDALKAMGIDMESITLVHELTHAAQDQNFELSTLPIEDETNDDLVMALKSVIEGDASAVGWKYQFKDQFEMVIGGINQTYKTGMLPGKAGKLPAYLRLSLTFPYGYGTDFIVKYLKGTKGELKDINNLFKDFPLSSEQILHPEKYYDKEKRNNPILVTMPDLEKLFGGPWKESFNNVHGEFATKLILREFKGDKLRVAMIDRAAEGWGGDRYVVLEDDKKTAMYVWFTTWDSPKDAKEFYEAYALALERKYEQETKEGREDKTSFTTPSGQVSIELKGSDVLVFDGATEAMLAKAGTIWKDTTKVEMTGFERLKKFVCEKDGVKEAFSGKCPKCGKDLIYKDKDDDKATSPDKKKKRDYDVAPQK
ncbi:MAG TPA: hypothetical protein VE981_22515 [Planctomycetota bacterium]|nr:hypothetical protein [Planctomycetota bacterium]